MSVPANEPILPLNLLSAVAHLVDKLLLHGIFLRGGIATGWAHHQDSIVFGDAMVSAYELESKVAVVPRILIADDIAESMSAYNFGESYLRQDSDGMWYLKPFNGLTHSPEDMPDPIQLHMVRDHIATGLKAARGNYNLTAKYRWLCNRFDEHISECEQRWQDGRDFGGQELVQRFKQPRIGIYLGCQRDG